AIQGSNPAGSTSRIFLAEHLAGLRYDPDAATQRPADRSTETELRVDAAGRGTDARVIAHALQRIAEDLRGADSVSAAIEELATRGPSSEAPGRVPDVTCMDAAVLRIWRRVL